MASPTLSRGMRSHFFSLPPHIRTSIYRNGRQFSTSSPRNLNVVDIAVAGPSIILDSVHSLGIPWYATLPLTAVLVRSTLTYYFSTRPGRKAAQIHSHLTPLAHAQANIELLHDLKTRRVSTQSRYELVKYLKQFNYWWIWNSSMYRLGKQFGARKFHPRAFLNFGFLIAFSEAIRLKCGTREGLLRLILEPFQRMAEKSTLQPSDLLQTSTEASQASIRAGSSEQQALLNKPPGAPHETVPVYESDNFAMPPSGEVTTKLDQLNSQATGQYAQYGTSVDAQNLVSPEVSNAASSYLDPSLHFEGFSWCVDLTLPDTTFILPTTLFITFLATVFLQPSVGRKPTGWGSPNQPNAETGSGTVPDPNNPLQQLALPPQRPSLLPKLSLGHRMYVAFATLFFFGSLQMPAAILLYFIPSIATGFLQSRYLESKYPLPPHIMPCKRPLRLKTRRDWVDS